MDFIVGLPRTLKKFDAVWVIVDRLTKSEHFISVVATYSSEQLALINICEIVHLHGWFELREARLLATDLVQDALEKVKLIQDPLRISQSRQKSYANRKTRDVAFMVGERVLLWVSPMKGVMRFGNKGKLSPRYIGPFEILRKVGEMAYKLALPPSLSAVHPVFHICMLRKYYGDPSHVLDFSSVQSDMDLAYDQEPVAIMDR
ncbi:uncharacterized protein [Nicotiana sylvestris]|uniref:uncharacterized protein n=1 Tax=Nicotiana sylvestris TaxID=4096 RepID=UPI00388C8605